MIYQCAWCRRQIGVDPPSTRGNDRQPISHGICDGCRSNFKFQMGAGFQEYIDDLDAPVLVVDAEGTVQTANRSAQVLVGKEPHQINGFKGGEIFECAYARLPEGCGNTRHCSGCSIRRAVMGTFSSGLSRQKISVCLQRAASKPAQVTNMSISTELVGDVVVLRIDRIDP